MPKKFYRVVFFLLIIFTFYGADLAYDRVVSPRVMGEAEEAVGGLEINFLDVGQGDAALLRTAGGDDILIDGGPDDKIIKKLGEYLPVGDWTIELMILSHPHSDHVAGLVEVLRRYRVEKIFMTGVVHTAPDYLAFLALIKEKNIPVEFIRGPRKMEIAGGDLTLNFLFPNDDLTGREIKNLNNASLVFKLTRGRFSILFAGDYEDEESLLSRGLDLRADIYKVSHHGSNTGNSRDFLSAINPVYAVISCGRDNFFGHPHYRTLKNLRELGAEIFRTDTAGDIGFLIGDQNIIVSN